ncbi:MAG: ABC transporter permease [Acidobacteria bacterium]|nr:ABC transporter permease [Acidobacteriota bacterium]
MNFAETLKLAFAAIWAHKLRSFLTLLGMIIGVTAFMIVLSLLQGFSSYVDEKLAGIGTNSFTVRRFSFDDFKDTDTIAAAQRRNKELTFDEMDFIRERAQLVGLVGAKAGGNSREVRGGGQTISSVQINGAEPIIAAIDKLDIAEGRYFPNPKTTMPLVSHISGWMLPKSCFHPAVQWVRNLRSLESPIASLVSRPPKALCLASRRTILSRCRSKPSGLHLVD